jgi:hypothetical protein
MSDDSDDYIEFDPISVPSVHVTDKTVQSAEAAELERPGKGNKPHVGTEHNDVNINPNISGVPGPHLQLPAGSLAVSKTATLYLSASSKLFAIFFVL